MTLIQDRPAPRADDAEPAISLEACDESCAPPEPGDLGQLLQEFSLLMSDHGRQVRSDVMRRDREYALWQLARARTTDDPLLRELACRLFARLQP